MRVRHWPNEQQTAELFTEVEVAADEYLAGVAGDLTLAEMVEMLGRRADGLVELWNNWGRDPAAAARGALSASARALPSSSSSMTTSRNASAAVDSDRRTLLGRPLPDPLGEPIQVLDLRGVRAQRVDLAVQRAPRRPPTYSARSDQKRYSRRTR